MIPNCKPFPLGRVSPSDSAAVPLNSLRPESIDEFIGQNHLKSMIRTAVGSSRHRNAPVPHCLITVGAGLGKTSLARLIAVERGVSFVASIAEAFEDSAAVKGLLSKLDDRGHDGRGLPVGQINPSILFIDEAHRLPRQSQELLYSAIEDRVLDTRVRDPLTGLTKPVREWVPSFTLVCASNRPGDLTASFRDRLRLELRLELYGEQDSAKIVRQAFSKMGLKCGPSSAALIAARGRGVPRKLVGICEHVRDLIVSSGKSSITAGVCLSAFRTLGIDTLGLNRQDAELLRHLAQNVGQPLGVKTLATLIHEDERALEENIEPFLMSKGLLARTPRGRAITTTGIEHLRHHHGWLATGRSLT
jgi:Holliday junction DNA helicase RuvB